MFVSEATILHADLDAFFASVEQRDDTRLRGRPVIVGGGVVLAASYEAKAFGVRTAMGLRQARTPLPGRDRRSAADVGVLGREHGGVRGVREHDTARRGDLDRRGVPRRGRAPRGSRARRRRSRCACGATCSSESACRSRSASRGRSSSPRWRARSRSPTGCSSSHPTASATFLHPLPIERLWGVGHKTAAKLHGRGIVTVGEVAALQERVLTSLLGPASGHHLHALAHNRDPRPVQTGRRRRSIGSQHALGRGPKSAADDRRGARRARRPRHAPHAGRRASRPHGGRCDCGSTTSPGRRARTPCRRPPRAPRPSWRRRAILLHTATPLIDERGITLIGVSVGNVEDDDAVQLELPFDRRSNDALDRALDGVTRSVRFRGGHPGGPARPRRPPRRSDAPGLRSVTRTAAARARRGRASPGSRARRPSRSARAGSATAVP